MVWKEILLSGRGERRERAVKVIKKKAHALAPIDYGRELDAIAKFSQQKVGCAYKGH